MHTWAPRGMISQRNSSPQFHRGDTDWRLFTSCYPSVLWFVITVQSWDNTETVMWQWMSLSIDFIRNPCSKANKKTYREPPVQTRSDLINDGEQKSTETHERRNGKPVKN
eukprot:scaffold2513_cov47-Attheya_sp.AAC.4